MIKIINNKRYNTDKANELATWDNGRYGNDFHHVTETLYKTKNGNYFLHGTGGAATEYSRQAGTNGRTGSEDIKALTPEDAIAWLEKTGQDTSDQELNNLIEEA